MSSSNIAEGQQQPPEPHQHATAAVAQQNGGTAALPASNLGPTHKEHQLLRMEAMSRQDTRHLLAALDVSFYVSTTALLAYLVLRWQPLHDGARFICTPSFSAVNLALAAVLLPATLATLAWTAHRCLGGLAARKRWTQRRRRLCGLYAAQLISCVLGMSCYLVSNALAVSPLSCASAQTRRAIYWLAFVRWSGWNTTFLVTVVKAHMTTIVPPAAAAAAAKQRWRRLLFLAVESPTYGFAGRPHSSEEQQEQQQQEQQQQQQQQQQAVARALAGPDGSAGRTPGTPSDVEEGSRLSATPGASSSKAPVMSGPPTVPQHSSSSRSQPPGAPARTKPQRPDMLVLDLPWAYHWPKAVLWVLFEACHVMLASQESQDSSARTCRALTDTCALQTCLPAPTVVGLLSAELGLALLYYAAWVWLILRSGRLLRTRSWQAFRVANLILRLETRLGVWAYSLIVASSVIFWFSSLADCSRAAFQHFGLPTTELMWAATSIIGMLMMQPHDPHAANPMVATQLQDFAWTEASLRDCIAARNAAATPGSKLAARLEVEPMFCFETAVKTFFFAAMLYADYEGARGTRAGSAVGVDEGLLEQLLKAMSLYNLSVHKVVYDDDSELKVLFAWSSDCVVVTFRGSSTAANWIADAMMWRSAHPGSTFKNTQAAWFNAPKIHSGFLRCWSGSGLNQRVLGMLTTLVETSLNPRKLKIILTGHSLGGAIATLAAYDLVKHCRQLDALTQVSVYTFGAPRAGNRSFARVYEAAVPDTWHVVNNQDTIPRGGKFIALYKRNGQRAIVSKTGDIVVRPTPLEASMLQQAWGSNPLNHLLASYQQALTAVALGQLDALKALPGGAEGLVDLIRQCPIMAESMYQYGDRQNLMLWIGGRVWYTLASRAPRELLAVGKLVGARAAANDDGSQTAAAAKRAAARQRRQQQQRARQAQRQQAKAAGLNRAAGLGPLARLGSLWLPHHGDSGVQNQPASTRTQQPQPEPAGQAATQDAVIDVTALHDSSSSTHQQQQQQQPGVQDTSTSSSSCGPPPPDAPAGGRLQHALPAAPETAGGRVTPERDVLGCLTGAMPAWPPEHQHHQQPEPEQHGRLRHEAAASSSPAAAAAVGLTDTVTAAGTASGPPAAVARGRLDPLHDTSLFDAAADDAIPADSAPSSAHLFRDAVDPPTSSSSSSGLGLAPASPFSLVSSGDPAAEAATPTAAVSVSSHSCSSPFAAVATSPPAAASPGSGAGRHSPFAAAPLAPPPTRAGSASGAGAELHGDGTRRGSSSIAAAEAGRLGISSSMATALDMVQHAEPAANRMLLHPAHSAPKALFIPAAALAGVRTDEKEGGLLSQLVSRAANGGSDSSKQGGASQAAAAAAGAVTAGVEDGATAARGALGQLLSSPHDAAAGTAADASSGGSSAGGRLLHALRHPRHHAPASSGSAAAAGDSSKKPDAVEHQRYLFSLDVRRTSLQSPLLPGVGLADSGGGVLGTRVHLPVLPEEAEEGA